MGHYRFRFWRLETIGHVLFTIGSFLEGGEVSMTELAWRTWIGPAPSPHHAYRQYRVVDTFATEFKPLFNYNLHWCILTRKITIRPICTLLWSGFAIKRAEMEPPPQFCYTASSIRQRNWSYSQRIFIESFIWPGIAGFPQKFNLQFPKT